MGRTTSWSCHEEHFPRPAYSVSPRMSATQLSESLPPVPTHRSLQGYADGAMTDQAQPTGELRVLSKRLSTLNGLHSLSHPRYVFDGDRIYYR